MSHEAALLGYNVIGSIPNLLKQKTKQQLGGCSLFGVVPLAEGAEA